MTPNPPVLAYSNPLIPRAAFLAEIRRHQDMDAFIKGTYGQGSGASFKGCSIGCAIHSIQAIAGRKYKKSENIHADFEKTIGVPEIIARLQDRIFEGLPETDAKLFTMRVASAIQEGADLSGVWAKIAPRILREIVLPTIQPEFDYVRVVVARVAVGWETGWVEDKPDAARSAAVSAAVSAESAAWSAAVSAARSAESAAWSAAVSARSAARSAAVSAAVSAESAAWSAAVSARSAARSAAYIKMSDILCEELALAPVAP